MRQPYNIKSSYFAKSGHLPNAVSIARFQPKWLERIKVYAVLAPPERLLRRKPYSYHDYFVAVLKNLDPERVARDLDGKVLLCYEKNHLTCHRRYVARWLEETLGIQVPEI